ncbi:MAG TPA: AAA family ATPase [Bacteroidales bacterium]|nr:AAA family ATPase [Bacteroidales bacterium]
MEILLQRFYEKYNQTSLRIVRSFILSVDWSNRFVGIRGSRGVGKTTLVLQYLKQNYKPGHRVLYVSLDHLYFSDHSLYDLASQFQNKGGELLALDEVHRYPRWAQELKSIYDDFPSLRVIFTGSSLLELSKAKADLSRRAVMYDMPGLSFREFLAFKQIAIIPLVTLQELFENHIVKALEICTLIKPLQHFQDYLEHGYYPFFLENLKSFHQKLHETIQVTLEIDIPQSESVQTSHIILLKKLLQVISGSVPFKPNMNAISQRTGISLNTLKRYIKYLSDAGLVSILTTPDSGINSLNKPEKIYLGNTNLMYSLSPENTEKGNIRETFFISQLFFHSLHSDRKADFLVNNNYLVEIGGVNKRKHQIQEHPNGFIVKDNIETGYENVIPLWLFGFLY